MSTFSFHPMKHITTGEGGWHYQQSDPAYNYRIADIQCALGIFQLKKLGRFVARRRQLAENYNAKLSTVNGITCPVQKEDCNSSWHLYVIQTPMGKRREIYDKLQKAGIRVNVHYIPVYKHPYYQAHSYENVCYPNAETLYENIISLPLYYSLTDEQQEYVIEMVRKAIG